MTIAKLSCILKIFSGDEPTPEEQKELFKEVLLMTLARASRADANVDPVEVTTVQTLVKQLTGEEVRSADIWVAAGSELYERAPLADYLSSASRKLDPKDRVTTVNVLAEVIKSDTGVSPREVDFFNMVAKALAVTPSEMAGLYPT